MTEYAERLKEIESEKEELRGEVAEATAERVTEIQAKAQELGKEADEIRTKMSLEGELKPATITEERKMNDREERAAKLVDSKKIEMRALLSTGDIAKPTAVGGINGLADHVGSIVDDVKAVALTGNGAYVVAYKASDAEAADVTDGEEIGGTEPTFATVTINPAEWGVVGSISNQVAKVSPLAYLAEVENSAVTALRAKAEAKIFEALGASEIAGSETIEIDADYLRTLVIGFKAIAGKGDVKLYLNREDLISLGKVRGTNEKKPLYTITFDAGSTMTGVISEGGLAVAFSVTDCVEAGTQYFGQPQTIEMPLWDQYRIETDESVYFTKNLIAYRGLQTANADLCAKGGMVKVSNA